MLFLGGVIDMQLMRKGDIVAKTKITVTIDKEIDNMLDILAKSNNVSKSELVREALRLYVNSLLSNPLENIEKRLENIEEKLEKELDRYNSLLAKNSLYTIAGRQHLIALHSLLRNNKNEAVEIAEKTWNVAIDRLKEKENKE